jgi:uncharacterized protein
MKFQFKRILVKLLRQNSSPHQIALGAGIGAFISVLPLYGLHTVLVILAMFAVRSANKIALFLGTNLSLTPTLPFITWGAYEIGRFMHKGNLPPLNWEFFKTLSWQKVVNIYWPLFTGSLVLGLICAVVIYGLTYFIVSRIKRDRADGSRNRNKL